MTTTKVIAITLLVCLPLLFSGCVEKKVNVYLPCKAEKPFRTVLPKCVYEGNMTKLAQCAAEKHVILEGDYDILSTRFDSCK